MHQSLHVGHQAGFVAVGEDDLGAEVAGGDPLDQFRRFAGVAAELAHGAAQYINPEQDDEAEATEHRHHHLRAELDGGVPTRLQRIIRLVALHVDHAVQFLDRQVAFKHQAGIQAFVLAPLRIQGLRVRGETHGFDQ